MSSASLPVATALRRVALRLLRASFPALAAMALAAPGFAQASPCPAPIPYQYLRYEENYRYLRNPACRTDPFDSVKYIALNASGDRYLSVGGEVRQTIEYFNNAAWGSGPQGSAYSLQRYMGHLDLHWGEHVRFFGQIKSGLEYGRAGGPRLIDEDKVDLNQAFLDLSLRRVNTVSFTLRAGRQELGFGATRFISAREGPNVHQTFDAARLIISLSTWRIDLFASKPVQTRVAIFDDYPDPGRTLWGAYATGPLPHRKTHLDAYYFGLQRSKGRFQSGTARELRHMLGTRLWQKSQEWDYDFEPALQWGSFGSGSILAWAFESEVGRTLRNTRGSPRLALRTEADSGNHDAASTNLQTFNPLFPRGLYHQLVNLNGHVNLLSLDPVVTYHLTPRVALTQDWDFFWRESLGDGLYGVGGNFIRHGSPGDGRYLGSQPTSIVDWKIQRHWSVILIYTHFFPGSFLRHTGPARPVNYVSGWVDFKF